MAFHFAMSYGHIGYLITGFLDMENWQERGINAALLAIHTIFHPTMTHTNIQKLDGESTQDEQKIILG